MRGQRSTPPSRTAETSQYAVKVQMGPIQPGVVSLKPSERTRKRDAAPKRNRASWRLARKRSVTRASWKMGTIAPNGGSNPLLTRLEFADLEPQRQYHSCDEQPRNEQTHESIAQLDLGLIDERIDAGDGLSSGL